MGIEIGYQSVVNIGTFHAKQSTQYQSLNIVDDNASNNFYFNGPSSYSPNRNIHYLNDTNHAMININNNNNNKNEMDDERIDIMKTMCDWNKNKHLNEHIIKQYIEHRSSTDDDQLSELSPNTSDSDNDNDNNDEDEDDDDTSFVGHDFNQNHKELLP